MVSEKGPADRMVDFIQLPFLLPNAIGPTSRAPRFMVYRTLGPNHKCADKGRFVEPGC